MEIKKAVQFVEKKTGIDLPDEKIEKTVSKLATKENIEKVRDKVGDIVEKIKK